MAIWKRKPDKGLLWHTDRAAGMPRVAIGNCPNSVASSKAWAGRSIPGGGCPWGDHAVPESFFPTLKTELIHRQTFHSREEAKQAVLNISECPLTGSGYIPLMDISPPLTSSCNKMPLNLVPGKALAHLIAF